MTTNFNFIKYKTMAFIVSTIIIVLSAWFVLGPKNINLGPATPKWFNLGIDFQGGLVQQVTVYSGVAIDDMRKYAGESNLGNDVQEVFLKDSVKTATSFRIKTVITDEDLKAMKEQKVSSSKFLESKIDNFIAALESATQSEITVKKSDLEGINWKNFTGLLSAKSTEEAIVLENVVQESKNTISPVYSSDLQKRSVFLVLFILGVMLVYISIRFKFEYAIGAVAALLHDTLIMLGVISLLGIEFDLTVLAAILTIIGYSINDTIVVFDRIRENRGILKSSVPSVIFNKSINQTLNRTIMTSVTTLLAVLALYIFGGEKIAGFSLTLIIGVLVGTYSSVFIASPIVYLIDLKLGKDKLKYKKMEEKLEKAAEKSDDGVVTEADTVNESFEDISVSKKTLKRLEGKK